MENMVNVYLYGKKYQVPESLQAAIREEFWGGCCDDEAY